ncbi:MAG TPA: hypothetical protein VMB21_04525 [Candidatus Limnocylindria bacterium]|jgi:hypothetical protein|nr:hypothetical protein [Candidatus Limnocylindria bacterium]
MNGKTLLFLMFGIGLTMFFFLDRWWTRRERAKLRQRIQEGEFKPRHFELTIVWDAAGFWVHEADKGAVHPPFPWANVVKATVFKRDMFSTDLVCLFFASHNGLGFEVHEEMNDWKKFTEALPDYLIGCKPSGEWWSQVAFPAFETNLTEIFSRAEASTPSGGAA